MKTKQNKNIKKEQQIKKHRTCETHAKNKRENQSNGKTCKPKFTQKCRFCFVFFLFVVFYSQFFHFIFSPFFPFAWKKFVKMRNILKNNNAKNNPKTCDKKVNSRNKTSNFREFWLTFIYFIFLCLFIFSLFFRIFVACSMYAF